MSEPIPYFNSSRFGSPLRFAFDFFGTLDTHEDVRALARSLHASGHEVHIVSSISPGLPLDSDAAYAELLKRLEVPYTKIWRVDHDPKLKVAVLNEIQARAFWDDVGANVMAAREAGFSTCWVGQGLNHHVTEVATRTYWGPVK